MKSLVFALIVMPFFIATHSEKKSKQNVIVLELFTSQGCSSCPPADRLLGTIEDENSNSEIITMSYHVDYWNYIGWKDPFSKSEYSDRQRAYSKKFNSSSYTPQLVVNGQEHFVGSNKAKLNAVLNAYSNMESQYSVALSNVEKRNDQITYNYSISGGQLDSKQLKTVLVIKERTTTIARGENRNRTLKNSNIVVAHDVQSVKTSNGNGTVTIPKLVKKDDELKLIVLLENSELDIIGAFQVKL